MMSFSLFCGYHLPKMDGSNAENGDKIWMIIWIGQYHMNTLWESNIAMENGPFIDDLAIKRLIFHSYVSLPDGKIWMIIWIDPSFGESKIG